VSIKQSHCIDTVKGVVVLGVLNRQPVSQGSASATRSHRTISELAHAVLPLPSSTRRAHFLYHQRIINPPQPTPSAFATGRFPLGLSITATETADCKPTWVNTHSLGESDSPLSRVASGPSAAACELLKRRARSTDARSCHTWNEATADTLLQGPPRPRSLRDG